MPDPNADSAVVEIPAGSLDADPGINPDKHIYVEFKAPWFKIKDGLPQFDKVSLRKYRTASDS
jgi:hypothetical protein